MKFNQSISLRQLCAFINAKAIGDPEFQIIGMNEIHMVEKGDLTFVDHPKYYDKALASNASAVLINKDVDCPPDKVLLISDDPFRDFNKIAKQQNPFISSSVSVSASAVIGRGSVIQPGAFIGNEVVIGENCIIHPGVVLYDKVVVGGNTIIHGNTVIGSDAFYFKRRPEGYDKLVSTGSVVIGKNVEIGASCTIDRGVSGNTVIGDGTKMDNQIHIGHDTVIGKNCLFAAQVGIAGVVTIEDDVILWGQVGVQKDLTIGKGAVVLGQSGIGKSLEGNKTYFGSPTRDARDKMKELAFLKRLPEVFEYIKS